MEKEISVIIPVYNASQYLERCVESIVFGEYENVQIILVEDCSKDNSWELCKKLSQKYYNVECYQNTHNSGVSYTRNQGLKRAKGKYIIFVDSDDWVSKKYVKKLVEEAEKNVGNLVLCGLDYIDKVVGYRKKYLWSDCDDSLIQVRKERFFDLVDRFLMQQLWNKIFLTEVIKKNEIRFDELQSMGEDFQFVLEYMEAANIEQCTIINEPLYYYVRANSSSLMSKFGLIENEYEYKRLSKLKRICGEENSKVKEQYDRAIRNTRRNYVYQIYRNKEKTKNEKIELIERIMGDGRAAKHYSVQKSLVRKEKIYNLINTYKKFPSRIVGRIQREKNTRLINKMKKKLKVNSVSIISQNCIGGVFCHDMGMEFLSPTVNLYFSGSDFVKFVLNMKYYVNLELKMKWEEEYPVGLLDDVKIYFMHYQTCSEAKESWDKRKQRILWDKIIVLTTDMEGFDEETYNQWTRINYPKILFTATKREEKGTIFFSKYKSEGKVKDLIPKREFYKEDKLIKTINQM